MKSNFAAAILILSAIFPGSLEGQTVIKPGYSLKSHETLEISRIENTARELVFHMIVENRIEGGNFCADRNIFVLFPDGSRSRIRLAEGIPVCPETHNFTTIGEKLEFRLRFAPLKQGVEWIDLVEECNDNCFSFYGITLDEGLNRRIDEAFSLVEKGEPARAMNSFMKLIEETDSRNLGSEGLLYITLIKLAGQAGNRATAAEWFNRFRNSGAPRAELYLKHLESLGIRY